MKRLELLKLLMPPAAEQLDQREAKLREYLAIGSMIAIAPVAGLVIYQASRAFNALFVLLLLLLVGVIANLVLIRSWRFTLWPARLTVGLLLLLLAYSLLTNQQVHTLLWVVCVAPLLVFVFGRLEGLIYALLMLAAGIVFLAYGQDELAAATLVNLVMAFILASTCALAFQSLYRSTSESAAERGLHLEQERQRFRDFASLGSDWLFEFDADGRFTYISQNLLDAVPADMDLRSSRSIRNLVSFLNPRMDQEVQTFITALQAHEPIHKLRFEFLINNRLFHVDITAQPLFEAGLYRGYRGIAEDVSAVVRHEEELRQKDLVLHRAQKMEAVGQLTSGLAHDFNNLLTIMRGNLDLLIMDQPQLADDAQLQAIVQAGERAGELTSKLLAFARKQPLQPRTINALSLVEGLRDMLQSTLGEGVRLGIDSETGLWPCRVDAVQLESALLNLCINARDAMPKGGRLNIALSNQTLNDDEQLHPGDYLRIDVTDTGEGIDEAIRELVFDPFFSTKAQSDGSGLGLSMVFGFARQSGGDVRIAQSQTGGACVQLWLPRGEQIEQIVDEIDAPSMRNVAYNILAVEDDEHVQALLRTMLASLGHQAQVLGSARTATQEFDAHQYDLLVTDVVLADDEDGLELAQKLREQEGQLPILFISGYAEPIADSGFQLDDNMRLLDKPFGIRDLQKALEDLMAG